MRNDRSGDGEVDPWDRHKHHEHPDRAGWLQGFSNCSGRFIASIRLELAALCIVLWTSASLAADPAATAAYEPREGDVYFQSFPHGELTDAIEGVTQSPLSHCGLLSRNASGWVVIEAVHPVKETPLNEWIARGRNGGRHLVFRLKEAYRNKIPAMVEAARTFLGRPYDIRYQLDDQKIYCSELVYKSFHKAGGGELGRLQALGDMNWQSHEAYIRKLEGGSLPLDRKMITPRAVSEAEQLEKVYEGP